MQHIVIKEVLHLSSLINFISASNQFFGKKNNKSFLLNKSTLNFTILDC